MLLQPVCSDGMVKLDSELPPSVGSMWALGTMTSQQIVRLHQQQVPGSLGPMSAACLPYQQQHHLTTKGRQLAGPAILETWRPTGRLLLAGHIEGD